MPHTQRLSTQLTPPQASYVVLSLRAYYVHAAWRQRTIRECALSERDARLRNPMPDGWAGESGWRWCTADRTDLPAQGMHRSTVRLQLTPSLNLKCCVLVLVFRRGQFAVWFFCMCARPAEGAFASWAHDGRKGIVGTSGDLRDS